MSSPGIPAHELLGVLAEEFGRTRGAVRAQVARLACDPDVPGRELAGADPEGGIATLVSLVSAADMFDLQPTNAPSAETTDSELGFDLLDTLADADTGLGALLGGDHHHDDAGGLFGGHGDPAHPLGL